MSRNLVLFLIFSLCVHLSHSKYNHAGKLAFEAHKGKVDTLLSAEELLKLSEGHKLINPEHSLHLAESALAQLEDEGNYTLKVKILTQMGILYNQLKIFDKALSSGAKVVGLAKKYNMQLQVGDGNSIMAVAYAQAGDFDNSSNLYFENVRLYERLGEHRLVAATFGNIGVDFIEQKQYEKALEYITKALEISEKYKDSLLIADYLSNLGAIYHLSPHKNFQKTMHYFRRSLAIAKKLNDIALQININLNIAEVFMSVGQMDSASVFLNFALQKENMFTSPGYLSTIYMAQGRYSYLNREYKKSERLTLRALEVAKSQKKLSTIQEAYNLLHRISIALGDTTKAYKYLLFNIAYSDSLKALQTSNELNKLEFRYSRDKAVKDQKLKQQKYFYGLTLLLLLITFMAIVAFLLHSKLKVKARIILLEKLKSEAEVKQKNKELSIYLTELSSKSEFLAEIEQKLTAIVAATSGIKGEQASAIITLCNEIKHNSNSKLFKNLTLRFSEINSDFSEQLLKRYPTLTKNEIRLCTYLRLNISSKDISILTNQSISAIEKARFRLRKKLNLTNSDVGLSEFVAQL